MNYKIEQLLDKIKVMNKETTDKLEVSLFTYKVICQEKHKDIVIQKPKQLEPSEEFVINIIKDGTYILVIKNLTTNEIKEITYNFYNNLLFSILSDIYKVLCNCGCETCDDCISEEELLAITNKLLGAYFLIKKDFKDSIENEFLHILSSLLNSDLECMFNMSMIRGSYNTTKLQKHLVGTIYLILYIEMIRQYILNDEDLKKFKTLFRVEQILPCLKSLGFPIDCIKFYFI